MTRFFISYTRHADVDAQLADSLADGLRAAGHHVFIDMAMTIGADWRDDIVQALEACDFVLLLLSETSVTRKMVIEEIRRATELKQERGQPDIFPVRVCFDGDPGYQLSGYVQHLQARRWTGPDDTPALLKEILSAVDASPQKAPGSPSRPAASLGTHNLPFLSIGSLFKGREETLTELQASLSDGKSHAAAVVASRAIHGLGGVGKSRLAVEFAWRRLAEYSAVLFVPASSPEQQQQQLAGLCGLLKLPEADLADEAAQKEAVLYHLAGERKNWLLILDNVDEEPAAAAVEGLLPRLAGRGHVLITSRQRNWGAGIEPVPVDTLSIEASVDFLLERTNGQRTTQPDDADRAKELAEVLGGLALALEQAAAFIRRHGLTFEKYLQRWQDQDARTRKWHNERESHYPTPLATTWEATLQELSPIARNLLNVFCWLAPEPIPPSLLDPERLQAALQFESSEESTAEPEGPSTADIEEGLAQLADYSMLRREQPDGALNASLLMHRLVQDITRFHLTHDSHSEWLRRTLQLAESACPDAPDDVRTWPEWDPLRPHIADLVQHADKAAIPHPTSHLMNELGMLLTTRADYAQAEPLYRRALAIDEQSLGKDHSNVAIRLNNLAQLLHDTNRLAEAEPLMRRVLEILENPDGDPLPDLAGALHNLARLLFATKRLDEAEPLMRQTLTMDEQYFGKDHTNVARGLSNLSQLLKETNRLSEAERLIRRALVIDEQSFGEDHPKVAIRLNNLAWMLRDTNRLDEAEPLMHRALAILQISLGDKHPTTQKVASNYESLRAACRAEGISLDS
jgi:tetratricopeptide (TPR) repeat protein